MTTQFAPSYYTHVIDGVQNPTVSAREIHEFLDVKKDFSDWMKVQIRRLMLKPDRNFVALSGSYEIYPPKGVNSRGRPKLEYFVTLDTAKHMALISDR